MRMKMMAFCGSALLAMGHAAQAGEPLSFQVSWRAQAEFAGFYQAAVKGFYTECGVDITIRQGGAGIDTTQLLVAGAVDAAMIGQNDGVMRMNEAGFKARAVMTAFQKFPSVLLAHPGSGVTTMEDMRGKPIMISAGNRKTFWPFLQQRYGYRDDQLRNYTGQIALWMNEPDAVQQGVVTNEPYLIKTQTGEEPKVFLLADSGYTPYSTLVTVSQKLIDEKPKVVQCLVDGSRKGWTDYMADPKSGFAAVKKENPQNTDGQMAYSFAMMQSMHLVENEDTAKSGLGIMTDARWKQHFDTLVAGKLFPPDFDYKSSYTLQFLGPK